MPSCSVNCTHACCQQPLSIRRVLAYVEVFASPAGVHAALVAMHSFPAACRSSTAVQRTSFPSMPMTLTGAGDAGGGGSGGAAASLSCCCFPCHSCTACCTACSAAAADGEIMADNWVLIWLGVLTRDFVSWASPLPAACARPCHLSCASAHQQQQGVIVVVAAVALQLAAC